MFELRIVTRRLLFLFLGPGKVVDPSSVSVVPSEETPYPIILFRHTTVTLPHTPDLPWVPLTDLLFV